MRTCWERTMGLSSSVNEWHCDLFYFLLFSRMKTLLLFGDLIECLSSSHCLSLFYECLELTELVWMFRGQQDKNCKTENSVFCRDDDSFLELNSRKQHGHKIVYFDIRTLHGFKVICSWHVCSVSLCRPVCTVVLSVFSLWSLNVCSCWNRSLSSWDVALQASVRGGVSIPRPPARTPFRRAASSESEEAWMKRREEIG